MKGQPFNRANDTEIIRLVSDNPGITCEMLSKKVKIPIATIQIKINRLCDGSRIFRQKKPNGNGSIYLLYTCHHAKKHNIPSVYVEKPEKTTLELQMMFNRLYRGLTLR